MLVPNLWPQWKKNWPIMGLFLFILLPFLLVWPAPKRSLDPALFDTQAQLEKPAIAELRTGQSMLFHVPMAPPLELESRQIQLTELTTTQWHQSAALLSLVKSKPWLMHKGILVEGLFSGSLRHCSAAAFWVQGTVEKEAPAKCTNSGLEIQSPSWPFGVFELKLAVKCEDPGCKLQLPYSPAAGKNWLHVKSTNENSLFALLTVAFQKQWVLTSIAVLGMILVSLTILSFFGRHTPFILVVGTLFIYLGLAPAYVGYDETAHLTMLEQARKAQLGQPIQPTAPDLNSSLVSHMVESAFFRLHNVSIPPKGACAHEVVGGCGESVRPVRYYSALIKLIPKSVLENISPDSLWLAGRLLNLIPLLFFTLSAALLFTGPTLGVVCIIASLLGSFWSQVGTTTNDVPQYLYGFLILGSWLEMIQNSSKKRKIACLMLCFLYFPIAYSVDVSALAALPALVGLSLTAIAFLIFSGEQETENTMPLQLLSIGKTSMHIAIPVILLIWLTPHFIGMLSQTPFWQSVAAQEPHLARISVLTSVNGTDVLRITAGYLSNLAGSFVWGHSHLPAAVTILWSANLAILTFIGLKAFSSQSQQMIRFLTCAGVVIALSGHLLIVTSIAGHMIDAEHIAADSFLKPRLTAPGTASVFFIASLGMLKIIQSGKFSSVIFKASATWNIILFYYLIGFYWGDIF